MAIPAYCVLVGQTVFVLSYLRLPLAATFLLEVVGTFIITLAVPSLRAGISDAVPANLRGAGFGAFNLVLGRVRSGRSHRWWCSPSPARSTATSAPRCCSSARPSSSAASCSCRARDHLEEDAAKIFAAILTAMEAEKAEKEAEKAPEREAGTDPA